MNKKNTLTVIPQSELEEILSVYDLGKPISYKRIEGGLANSNYKLETEKGFYLLKICDEKTPEQLETHVAVLNHFKTNKYFTAYPVAKKDGSFVFFNSSKNLKVVIYDFLSGAPKAFSDVTEKVMTELGHSVGKLHLVPKYPGLSQFPMGIVDIDPFLSQEVKGTGKEDHEFVKFLSREIERLRPIIFNDHLPKGIVHGDVFADNTLFEGEKLIAIIDFEEVCYDAFLVDIGVTISGCCYPNNKLDKKLVDAFLKAYNEIRPLTELENKLLNDFIFYANLSIAFWRFRQFQIRNPDEELKDKYKEMMERLTN